MTHLRHISLFLLQKCVTGACAQLMALYLTISYAFIGIKVSQRFRKFGGVGNGRGRRYYFIFLVRNRGGCYSKWVRIIQSYYFKWFFPAVTFALLARQPQYLQFFTTIVLSPVQLELNWEVFSYICAKIVSFIVYAYASRVSDFVALSFGTKRLHN